MPCAINVHMLNATNFAQILLLKCSHITVNIHVPLAPALRSVIDRSVYGTADMKGHVCSNLTQFTANSFDLCDIL